MKLYKLTEQDGSTFMGYEYGVIGNEHVKKPRNDPKMCSSEVFHAYRDINLALLVNPIHASIENPRCFEIEGDVVVQDYLKVGSFHQKVIKEIETPAWVGGEHDLDIRVNFAVECLNYVASLGFGDDPYTEDVGVQAARAGLYSEKYLATIASGERGKKAYYDCAMCAAACAALSASNIARRVERLSNMFGRELPKIDFSQLAIESVNKNYLAPF